MEYHCFFCRVFAVALGMMYVVSEREFKDFSVLAVPVEVRVIWDLPCKLLMINCIR